MKKQNTGLLVKLTGILLTVSVCVCCGCAKEQETDSLFELMKEESSDSKEALADVNINDVQKEPESDDNGKIVVHICGEVVCPGVYEVPSGSRIYDVLMFAGGFTEEASEDYLNLAAPVSDGIQIRILSEEEAEKEQSRQANDALRLININEASVADLCTLPGVGESRAEDIIAYRNANGYFASPEDIMQVSGIKETLYEKIKDKICVE